MADEKLTSGDINNSGAKPNHRHRRWHVAFGNPALGTYNGSIVTLHRIKNRDSSHVAEVDDAPYNGNCEDDVSSCGSFSSCTSLDPLTLQCCCNDASNQEKSSMNRTAVMTNVPPHQVPDGMICLVNNCSCVLFSLQLTQHHMVSFIILRSTQSGTLPSSLHRTRPDRNRFITERGT